MGIALRRLILSIKSVGWWGRAPEFCPSFLSHACPLPALSLVRKVCIPSD